MFWRVQRCGGDSEFVTLWTKAGLINLRDNSIIPYGICETNIIAGYHMRNPKRLMSEWGGGERNPYCRTISATGIGWGVLIKPSLWRSSRCKSQIIIGIIQKHKTSDHEREKSVPLWGYTVLSHPAFRGLAQTPQNINLSHLASRDMLPVRIKLMMVRRYLRTKVQK